MFRQVSVDLQGWLRRKDRRPLLLRGARQVGKTWLARALAREQGVELVEVNFELRPDAKEAFRSLQPAEILKNLAFLGFPVPKAGTSLLFLDEIQECPAAIVALRYFYEMMPDLAVLGSGSLLEFAMEAGQFSLPVGRVDTLWVHPMGFAEFLRAKGHQALAGALEAPRYRLSRCPRWRIASRWRNCASISSAAACRRQSRSWLKTGMWRLAGACI